jgi:hypothetical protein
MRHEGTVQVHGRLRERAAGAGAEQSRNQSRDGSATLARRARSDSNTEG